MTDNTTNETTTNNPTTKQLLAAVKASAPSAARDISVTLLESGAVTADGSIGDLKTALDSYYQLATPAQQR